LIEDETQNDGCRCKQQEGNDNWNSVAHHTF
jgi:hypothetical protein